MREQNRIILYGFRPVSPHPATITRGGRPACRWDHWCRGLAPGMGVAGKHTSASQREDPPTPLVRWPSSPEGAWLATTLTRAKQNPKAPHAPLYPGWGGHNASLAVNHKREGKGKGGEIRDDARTRVSEKPPGERALSPPRRLGLSDQASLRRPHWSPNTQLSYERVERPTTRLR